MITEIDGVPVRIIRSARRTRTITLTVLPAEVTVRVPDKMLTGEIERLLQRRQAWVLRTLEAQRVRATAPPAVTPDTAATVWVQGVTRRIVLRSTPGRGRAQIHVQRQGEDVMLEGPVESLHDAAARTAIRGWLQALARTELEQRTQRWASTLGLQYRTIRLKDQKTRWGSCSSKGNLNFNWRLIMAPPDVMDYIVIHELCHLREMNHSTRFWSLVQAACPTYRQSRTWLRHHGRTLTLWE